MKTRIRTLAVIFVAAGSASVLTGLAISTGSSAAPNTPTSTTCTMPMSMSHMDSMMNGTGMTAMHDAMTRANMSAPSDASPPVRLPSPASTLHRPSERS